MDEKPEVKENQEVREINEYYHDELDKALGIMWSLQNAEIYSSFKLPVGIREKVIDFTDNFKFRYEKEEENQKKEPPLP